MGKTKELALKQELEALANTPGIRKDISEKASGLHVTSTLGSLLFGCGGAIGGMFLSIPTLLIPGIDQNLVITGLTSFGLLSSSYVASKWIQSGAIELPIDDTFGRGTTKKFNYMKIRRTLTEKRYEIPIQAGRVSEKGEEILRAVLVTSRKGVHLETLVRENPGAVWDKHIATVKDAYSIQTVPTKELAK